MSVYNPHTKRELTPKLELLISCPGVYNPHTKRELTRSIAIGDYSGSVYNPHTKRELTLVIHNHLITNDLDTIPLIPNHLKSDKISKNTEKTTRKCECYGAVL